jgi:hypothetical protein
MILSAVFSVIALIVGKGWKKRTLALASLLLVFLLQFWHSPNHTHAGHGMVHAGQQGLQGAPADKQQHVTDPNDPLCDPTGEYTKQ